jgi:hypothetical protein
MLYFSRHTLVVKFTRKLGYRSEGLTFKCPAFQVNPDSGQKIEKSTAENFFSPLFLDQNCNLLIPRPP